MFSLSQTCGHAIKALACLAGDSCRHAFIHDIADCSGVPRAYLAKILHRLSEHGIVEAKRGYRGGVWLVRPPDAISLWDISVAIDGEGCLSECMLGESFCKDLRDCPTHAFWKSRRHEIKKELEDTTLEDVIAFEHKQSKTRARRVKKGAIR